ncbi:hypothetical protein JYU34_014844 [Plutella xylostella]|uniref:Uncharacterized protein n=1 Tax=Plutella xylostella TaxID=51655 RepID=A0ABQ7Q992_PLUXY|nr:hypothetical protein JYU34_014844 [Plutella xylostella]
MSLFNTRLGRGLPRSPRCCRLVEVTNKRCAQRGSGGAPRRGAGSLGLDIRSACLRTVPTAPAGSAALCNYNPYKLVFKPDYWRTTAGERPGMFTTPPPLRKMVQTRSAHEREKMALLEQSTRDGPSGLDVNVATSEKITTKNELKACEPPVRKVGSCMKMEIGCHKSSTSKKMSMASSKRSIEARKKQLELEAAEAIANINKKLIKKKLEADIAALEDSERVTKGGTVVRT